MATRRRGRALIFVAVILILVLVIVFAGWQFFLQPMLNPPPASPAVDAIENTPTPVEPTIEVVMTTQKIPRGAYLTMDSLVLVSMPKKDYVEGSFIVQSEDPNAIPVIEELVYDKRARARSDLKERTPLTMELLVTEEGSMSSFDISRGMVAMSIPANKMSSVSYGIQAGDHVNVIVSMLLVDLDPSFQTRLPNKTSNVTLPGRLADQFTGVALIDLGLAGRGEYDPTLGTPIYVLPSEDQRPRLVSQTIIQDAIVLQVGIFPTGNPTVAQPTPVAVADPNAPQDQQAQPPPPAAIPVPDVITLIVSPQDAVTLNYLMLAGARLNLVLRAAGDTDTIQTEPVTLQFILDQYGIPIPAKLPYGMEQFGNFTRDNNTVLPFPDAGVPVDTLPNATPMP